MEPDSQTSPTAQAEAGGLASSGYLDEGLVKAMTPVTERSIRRSVELNSSILAEALFPIIGPAIRRSIQHALESMVQSLNSAVENSLSPESLKWRAEAWRTGKTFAEVVVLRTLLYRVEQVFLIEKSSGLLLQQVAVDPKLAENSELISAMLTAIQDFVRDSFQAREQEGIGSVTIGGTTLWIETGPQAVLAGVIRGTPPRELREVFHDTVVAIHQDYLKPLASFGGDPEIFAPTRELLQGCLRQQKREAVVKEERKRRFTPFHAVALVAVAGLITWGAFAWRSASRWSAFREHLRTVPGIVLIRAEKSGGKYKLEGLRDPAAQDPLAALPRFGIPPDKVQAEWRPYLSLDPEIVELRSAAPTASPSENP